VVINGRRIFCKGADWIPCDAFENRQTPARYRDLLESAVAANMNMLRVWGGGQFEHPAFYELCDEMGVMLWHDFMFSCATYPGDEHFLAGVRKEIAHQLRNLRDHACIALWCGDNECIGAAKWFDRDEKVRAQNIQLCVARAKELEKLCATYDPTRCFWPSSPCLGPGNYGDGWKDDSSGDMHFWQVWFGDKPFSHYFSVRPRFCSEFGFQSYPTKEEALTFVTPDQLNPTAPDFAYHQKCFPNGNKFIMQMLLRNFRFPEGVDAVLYLSQIQQAMAIRTAVEAWRHLQPRCMGVIYWQLNNNWPVASWSSLDYSGKWKPLHYNMKRAYAPVAISAGPKWGDPSTIEVWAVNDRDDAFDGTAALDLWTFEGAKKPFASRAVRSAPRAAAKAGEYKLDAFGYEAARRKLFLRMRLEGRAGTVVENVSNEWMFDLFMNHDLAKTDVKAAFAEKDGTFLVTLSADKPAFFVWANVWQTRGEFDDNAFTLYPGEPRTLVFTPKAPGLTLDAFKKAFSVTHLRETYR
jgi:beta-mannosidase